MRHEAGELDCDISVVISNHADLKPIVETFGIPFKVVPITPENKSEQEMKEISILKDQFDVDVIVLARYMQVLSDKFLDSFAHDQMINIHHSFLPAFMGGRPYSRAYERGVKLVGATVSCCYYLSRMQYFAFNEITYKSAKSRFSGALCHTRAG